MAFLMAWCTAIIILQWQASLLPPLLSYGAVVVACISFYMATYLPKKSWCCHGLAGFLLGLAYANGFAAWSLGHVLPPQLERQVISLQLSIARLSPSQAMFQRSYVRVLNSDSGKMRNLQLDWYGDEEVAVCDIWQVKAKLKRPHGLRNPRAWSYRQYALEKQLHAKGYVLSAEKIGQTGFCWEQLRQAWHNYVLQQLPTDKAAWLIALSTGDKTLLGQQQYQLLQAFGINHLFVISGLHIGLAASVVYSLILLLRRLGLGLVWQGDWRLFASVFALLAALAYAALANFTIPAQRALLMLVVFFAGGALGLRIAVWLRFFLAMALVLLINPFAAMNIGFVLSFAAVAVLIVVAHEWRKKHLLGKLYLLLQSQFFINLGLSPLLLFYFSQAPLLAPLVNLFAIPYVSFLVVPVLLLALLLWVVLGQDLGLLQLANGVLTALLGKLEQLQIHAANIIALGQQWFLADELIILLLFASVILLLWRFFIWRLQALLLLLWMLLLWPNQYAVQQGGVHIAFIDVGQGLAVLIRTEHHNLLYDTGIAWPQGSMAEQAVMPVMQHYGVKQLDKAMISHFHNDHAGGWRFLHNKGLVKQWLAPSSNKPFKACQRGMSWHWDGVDFAVLSPEQGFVGNENDGSCVLLITAAGKHVLLTGDIGKQQEIALVQQQGFPAVDVLQAAHHGSNSSSSYALITRMPSQQSSVVFSTGYLNRYGHPHKKVQQRFSEYGIQQFNTAEDGLIDVWINPDGNVKLSAFRQQQPRYWDDVVRNRLEY